MSHNSMNYNQMKFFNQALSHVDPQVSQLVVKEEIRQKAFIELIAPKNYMSQASRQAMNSFFSFTTVEGYPNKRYHAGVVNIDAIEMLAIERSKKLFKCSYANVQPHSGTQANQATMLAFLKPGDKILSMSLKAGGHLSHGAKSNFSGKWFNIINYGVREEDGLIDYEEVENLCLTHQPRLIIVGGSSYTRVIDFLRFRTIADKIGAYLMADVAHFSGLIASGLYPNPFPHCHVVTTTTNKNLRGPRGGLILSNDLHLEQDLNTSVFPGIQGGPLPEFITAKAVTFLEALQPEFKQYSESVLQNARVLAHTLQEMGYKIVSGGTDTPLVVVDLREQGITGDNASKALEAVGVSCNKNMVPGDPTNPSITSGVRFGTSAITTRGLQKEHVVEIAMIIANVFECVRNTGKVDSFFNKIRKQVKKISDQFPLYTQPD